MSLVGSTVSLPSLASWLVTPPVDLGTPIPMSARPVSPRPLRVWVIVALRLRSMPVMPESPKSWPFWRSALVVAVGIFFSVISARVLVTTAL